MSIWEDVSDGIDSPRETFKVEANIDITEEYLGLHTEEFDFEALAEEMPSQKKFTRELFVIAIEEDGQIIGVRISGIQGIDLEEDFHTNMRLEEDGEDIILYDKEWAAIHEQELEMYLDYNEGE